MSDADHGGGAGEYSPSKLLRRVQLTVDRLNERRDLHRGRSRFIRIAYAIAGLTVLLAGLLMLVLPGPALIVIPLGLAILSLEFAWAERLLDGALDRAAQADRAVQSPQERRLLIIAGVLAVAAVAAWGAIGDVPVLPF